VPELRLRLKLCYTSGPRLAIYPMIRQIGWKAMNQERRTWLRNKEDIRGYLFTDIR